MSHTPGPWTADDDGDSSHIVADNKIIGEFWYDTRASDARLAAAAPELLAALEGLVRLFQLIAPRVPQEVMADVQDNHRWHDAHAIIFKAKTPQREGGSP